MQRREWQQHMWRHPHSHQTAMAKETALEHQLVRALPESTDQEILDVAEQGTRGNMRWHQAYSPASTRINSWQNSTKSWASCLVRAGLCGATGTAWSLSRWTRCSCAYLSSWARSPSVESRRKEVAKQPRGWLPDEELMAPQQTHQEQSAAAPEPVTGTPTSKQGTSLGLPQETHRCVLLSPSPPHPHCTDEQLHHSVIKLHLQPQQQESTKRGVSQMQPESTPTHATGHPCSQPGSATEMLASGSCTNTGPVWPYQWPGSHTTVAPWLGQPLGRRCHWWAD